MGRIAYIKPPWRIVNGGDFRPCFGPPDMFPFLPRNSVKGVHILLDERAVRPGDLDTAQRPFLRTYRSWPRFHDGPRQEPQPLLRALARYPDCVLVAGCQRSGTTMLTRLIAGAQGFRPLKLTHDDELDAALALAGYVDLPHGTRYCLQTTYLNERYEEYSRLGPQHRLLWVIRNPHSVVHSMVHNWRRWALDELYHATRADALAYEPRLERTSRWPLWVSRVDMACSAYVGKSSQILKISRMVPPGQLLMVEYDEMVQAPSRWLPVIFGFIGAPYDSACAAAIRSDSVTKAQRSSETVRAKLEALAMPTYRECLRLRDERAGAS